MATTTLVNNTNIFEEGKKFLKYLDSKDLNIEVAFWLYQKENNSWKLIFSASEVEELGSKFFYTKILRDLKKFNSNLTISPSDIVVLPYSDKLISAFRKIKKHSVSIDKPVRFSNDIVDNVFIEDALIYRLS